MALIKDHFIPREEISNLLWGMNSEISTHSLSMWLKSKTNNEFVVVPREFVYMTVLFFENMAEGYKDKIPHFKEMIRDLATIKNYL
jgi:hypothetical protein